MEYEQFDRRLARECAKAFSQSTGLGCTLSDKTGRAFDEYGYGCESCGMCAAAGASHDRFRNPVQVITVCTEYVQCVSVENQRNETFFQLVECSECGFFFLTDSRTHRIHHSQSHGGYN